MVLKRKDPGRAYSPARKALSRSGLGLCRSPRRGLSTSFQASAKPVPMARPGTRPAARPGLSSKGSSANMKVVVRVRPLSQREIDSNARVIVDVVDEKMVVFDPKREEESFFFHGARQKGRDITKKQNRHTQYLFDRVFGAESCNEDVFEGSTKSIVTSVLDGFNCSVFVYGATGAGKTFTMLGTQENPGITYRTMVDLFKQIEDQKIDKDFEIGVSYLEVYNETVRDLLNPNSGALALREDSGAVMVAGLKMERISDPDRMFELLAFGNQNRSQHPTDANAESSRSHAVFQVFIKMKTKANGQVKRVKLSMIDLAGSERGAATGCAGMRFKEGSNINKSLLALGNCINALADGQRHIPYRDSKLTRLLKDSLGGNCQTVMIANVAPAHHTYEDTHNTLKYATRAKSIKFQIKRNIVSVELHVSHYIKMVEDLQSENDRLKSENDRLKSENENIKKEFENDKARNLPTTATEVTLVPAPCPPPQSHLPPAVAAAVAAITNKIKPAVSTSSVGVNTSPLKGSLRTEDLKRLKDEAEKLYNEKARLHQRYLNMHSSDKVLRWRIKMKQRTIDRVQAMSSTPSRTDQAQFKVDRSVDQFRGRLNSVNECQEAVSVEEKQINLRLDQIRVELQRLGIFDEVAPHLNAFELQYLNQELFIKCQHLEKLIEYLDRGFENHDEVLKKVSTLFRKYYNLVRGHGHMNEELMNEHEAVMRGLEGIKSVQWNQERDEICYADGETETNQMPSSPRPSEKVTGNYDSIPCQNAVTVTDSTEPAYLPTGHPQKVQDNESVVLLQSPLCSSSSNPSKVSQNLDTASMLNTLGDLESKVNDILNTSISSTAVEVGYELRDPPGPVDKERPLNITFDGDANLNSTFTKDLPAEPKANLNETFEKADESEHVLPDIDGGNLNGTFSLEDNFSSTVTETVAAQEQRRSSLPIPVATTCSAQLKKPASPSSLSNGSPHLRSLLVPPSRSPLKTATATTGLQKKECIGSPSVLNPDLLKKTQTSSPSGLLSGTFLKKSGSSSTSGSSSSPFNSGLPSSKVVASSSSPTFAMPAAVGPKSIVVVKRPVGGHVDKRKALSTNLAPNKQPGSKLLGINRNVGGSNSRLHVNTPSKVKLAWNKENRNANSVASIKPVTAFKPTKIGTKPVPKSSAAPIPLNDTFTK